LGKLIAGMFHLEKLKKLVCMNNEMGRLSTHHLEKLLLRPEPNCLDELRLTNCRLSPSCVNDLLEVLRDEERCQVRRLGLVKADFGTYNSFEINDCINNLLALVEESTIIDLDLSWNGLGPDVMFSVAERLSQNRRLQFLNLSHNNFKELTDFTRPT
jgi:Ran GTPase-activating protein (RanGAP) involved in mRNA processing and transport